MLALAVLKTDYTAPSWKLNLQKLVECRTLWGELEWDTCCQCKYITLTQWAKLDYSYNAGTELTGWSSRT